MAGQTGLFDAVKLEEPEPMTTIRIGSRVAQIPLRRKRREAIKRLMEILVELEGKDVHIGSYEAGGRHFWLDNLKLPRLKLDFYPMRLRDDQNYIPSVIVLWGSRSGYSPTTWSLSASKNIKGIGIICSTSAMACGSTR